MKRIAPVLALILLIFLAGCTSNEQNLPAGTGVEISFFSAPTQVDIGDTFSVDFVIQNNGDNTAKNIKAQLVQKSNFELANDAIKEKDFLLPPVIEKGLEGEKFVTSWILKAPDVPANQLKSVIARATYDYSSSATSNIYVVPKEQYDEMGPESFQTYSTSTQGPVLIEIQPLPAFKIKSSQKQVNAVVVLSIADVGNGAVIGNIRNFKLTLTSGGGTYPVTSACKDLPASGEIELLGQDRAVSIKCEFPIKAGTSSVSYVVDASADYTYYIDSSPVAITVKL